MRVVSGRFSTQGGAIASFCKKKTSSILFTFSSHFVFHYCHDVNVPGSGPGWIILKWSYFRGSLMHNWQSNNKRWTSTNVPVNLALLMVPTFKAAMEKREELLLLFLLESQVKYAFLGFCNYSTFSSSSALSSAGWDFVLLFQRHVIRVGSWWDRKSNQSVIDKNMSCSFSSAANVGVIFPFTSRVSSVEAHELLPWVCIHEQPLCLLLIRSVLLLHQCKFEIFFRALGAVSGAVSHCNKRKWWSRTFKGWLLKLLIYLAQNLKSFFIKTTISIRLLQGKAEYIYIYTVNIMSAITVVQLLGKPFKTINKTACFVLDPNISTYWCLQRDSDHHRTLSPIYREK